MLGYKASEYFQNEFDNALMMWAHKRIFEMLSIKDSKKANELATCKLYDNCPYRVIASHFWRRYTYGI